MLPAVNTDVHAGSLPADAPRGEPEEEFALLGHAYPQEQLGAT